MANKGKRTKTGRKDWMVLHQPLERHIVRRIDRLAAAERRSKRTEMIQILLECGLAQREAQA